MPGRQPVAGVAGQRQEAVGGHHGVLLAAAALAADPAVADRDRARQHPGDVGVVGDQDDGRAVGAVDVGERGQHLVARRVVELAGGLVAQEQARARWRSRRRPRPAGAQAGRQLAQRPVGVVGEADLREHLGRVGRASGRPGGPGAGRSGRCRRGWRWAAGCGRRPAASGRPRSRAAGRGRAAVRPRARCRPRRPCRRWAGGSPASRLIRVDLPEPDGPSRPTISPGRDVEVDARQRGDVVALGVVDVHQAAGADREAAPSDALPHALDVGAAGDREARSAQRPPAAATRQAAATASDRGPRRR